ncbi:MAG: hypothetical protein CL568_05750 [Alphaproteobacteria bacterium]|nr:hypothetical protein [Alphaproteobacteria bacterium]PPR12791.1 MAG: hypothetical protein CFH42_01766 [Alphaproteobacteria bacterium MarineAlpha12_Bin1]
MKQLRKELPFDTDEVGRFLPWIIFFMVFLGLLALAITLSVSESINGWNKNLSSHITIQVPPETASSNDLQKVITVLKSTKGIKKAQLLDSSTKLTLMEPWLGKRTENISVLLPEVIDVETDRNKFENISELKLKLKKVIPEIIVDDHREWLMRLISASEKIKAISVAVLILIGVISVISVMFATKTGLAVHTPIINLLHLMGAKDTYIVNLFQLRVLYLAIIGSLIGSVSAFIVLYIFKTIAHDIELSIYSESIGSLNNWFVLILVPLMAIVVSVVTTRRVVFRTLARMP